MKAECLRRVVVRWVFVGVVFFVVAGKGWGLSYFTTDGAFTSHVGGLLEAFEEVEGRPASSWDELEEKFGYDGYSIFDGFDLVSGTERYELLAVPVSMGIHGDREIVVVTRRAFEDVSLYMHPWGGTGRRLSSLHHRVVIRNSNSGEYSSIRLTEAELAPMFAAAGVARPVPDTLPERKWVAKVRRQLLVKRILLRVAQVGVLVGLLVMTLRFRRGLPLFWWRRREVGS